MISRDKVSGIISKLIFPLFIVLSIGVGPNKSEADTCLSTTLGLQASASSQTVGPNGGTVITGCIVGGDQQASISAGASTLYSQAFAETYYGINRVSISGSTNYDPVNSQNNYPNSFASAQSIWSDTITITGGSGTGTVTFGEQVDGIYTTHTSTIGGIAAFANFGDSMQSGYWKAASFGLRVDSGSASDVWAYNNHLQFTYNFTYDVPFLLQGSMSTGYGGLYVPPYYADFFNTAILDTVILPDGATLISQSGATYPVQGTPVPEPSTMLLLGSGLVGVVRYGRKRLKK